MSLGKGFKLAGIGLFAILVLGGCVTRKYQEEYIPQYDEMISESGISLELRKNNMLDREDIGKMVRTRGTISNPIKGDNGKIFYNFISGGDILSTIMSLGNSEGKLCLVTFEEGVEVEEGRFVEVEGFLSGTVELTSDKGKKRNAIVIDVKNVEGLLTSEQLSENEVAGMDIEEIEIGSDERKNIYLSLGSAQDYGGTVKFEVRLEKWGDNDITLNKVKLNILGEDKKEVIETIEKETLVKVLDDDNSASVNLRFGKPEGKIIGEVIVSYTYNGEEKEFKQRFKITEREKEKEEKSEEDVEKEER